MSSNATGRDVLRLVQALFLLLVFIVSLVTGLWVLALVSGVVLAALVRAWLGDPAEFYTGKSKAQNLALGLAALFCLNVAMVMLSGHVQVRAVAIYALVLLAGLAWLAYVLKTEGWSGRKDRE